ncbi:hypothetical protein ACLB2K_006982 [Fragaria x ananassa]
MIGEFAVASGKKREIARVGWRWLYTGSTPRWHAKSIANSLALIDKHISIDDLVLTTLHSLEPDYLMLRTTLTQQASLPNFTLRLEFLPSNPNNNLNPPSLILRLL